MPEGIVNTSERLINIFILTAIKNSLGPNQKAIQAADSRDHWTAQTISLTVDRQNLTL
jgi:hypothetical protein